jgi:two-component system LytT family response regulator
MDNIRTVLVDDEKPARTRLTDLLEKHRGIHIVGVASDGNQALTLIREQRPELLFLDIQMPDLDGFGVLRQLDPNLMPVTVFVTAYDKYAIQAFEAHAFDYLLKPFSDERFEAALERARRQIQTQKAGELASRVTNLVSAHPPAERIDRLLIRSSSRVTFLEVADIDWIEAAGVYVNIHCGGKSILHRSTIGHLHGRLDPERFVRIHRSAIINTTRIRELQPRTHGDYSLMLKDGTELTLSRSYRGSLERWLRQRL